MLAKYVEPTPPGVIDILSAATVIPPPPTTLIVLDEDISPPPVNQFPAIISTEV